MFPYRDSRVSAIAITFFFLVVAGYAYYEARGILFGPRITITSDTAETHQQFITLTGKAERIATVEMNGAAVDVTEDGLFSEPYLLAPGLNRITFDATDKYNHHVSKVVQIIYTPDASTTPASSVPELKVSTSSATTTTGMAH